MGESIWKNRQGGYHEERVEVPELSLVGCSFSWDSCGVHGRAPIVNFPEGVTVMLQYILFPKPGWMILHGVAIILFFLLGYTVKFW